MKRKFLLSLFALLTSVTAGATDFITDVKVIGGPTLDNDVNPLWYDMVANGWTGVSYNLNRDAGGDFIYLLYKTASNTDGLNHGYITDFLISNSNTNDVPDAMLYDGRTYFLVAFDGSDDFKSSKGDLNRGAGGDYIHLYYTMSPFVEGHAVTSITFNETQSGAVGVNGQSTGYDLNAGCNTNVSIYMHITTAPAATPSYPSTVTLTAESGEVLLHNGQTLTGTGGDNTRVVIAADATVTLSDVTITSPIGTGTKLFSTQYSIGFFICDDYPWSGITCQGNATIVLADGTTNLVQAGGYTRAAILAGPQGSTLTIRGNGTLRAQNFGNGAAIGSNGSGSLMYINTETETIYRPGDPGSCGNIVIESGTIIAEYGIYYEWDFATEKIWEVPGTGGAAAIGSGNCAACGDITIGGGRVNIEAHAGGDCHLIGPGRSGTEPGYQSTCGTLTIGGVVQTDYITGRSFVYPQRYSITYNLNGGTVIGSSNPTDYSCNNSFTLAEPQRIGYQFTGWTWDGQTIPQKNVVFPYDQTGDKTFTAHWSQVQRVELTPDMVLNDVILADGHVLTGTGGVDTHVTITDGATVTLDGVTITNISSEDSHNWGGINCQGNATIILADNSINTVKGGADQNSGIFIPAGYTLTIRGNGTLNAMGSGIYAGPGIGGQRVSYGAIANGNIVIESGYIIATGTPWGPGIGNVTTSQKGGYITINGGTVIATTSLNTAGVGDAQGIGGYVEKITINGGTVIATGGRKQNGSYAESIGGPNTVSPTLFDVSYGQTRKIWGLKLSDDTDNTEFIGKKNGQTTDVQLRGRTLYKDGTWNTLCVPSNATKTGPLAGAVIKELDTETAYNGHKTGFDNGTLYLNFKDAESIVAGRPYIVKWADMDDQTPIINPSNDVVSTLGFISEVPTYDNGQASNWNADSQGPAKLVDSNTDTKYGLSNANPWVEFHYANAITPKGYALWTAEDTYFFSTRNPTSWTIKAKKNSDDADWITLTTVDNSSGDKLPMANNTRTVFNLDNTEAYQYFRFEAVKDNEFQLAELQFCTVRPDIVDVVNPIFSGVTINAAAPTTVTSEDGKVSFVGSYSPVALTPNDKSNLFLGGANTLYYPNAANNADGYYYVNACRAFFSLDPNATVKEFKLNFEDSEDATSIDSLTPALSKGEGVIYNLAGQRLSKMQRGINIVNGKKILK